jgi:hypothetical protein
MAMASQKTPMIASFDSLLIVLDTIASQYGRVDWVIVRLVARSEANPARNGTFQDLLDQLHHLDHLELRVLLDFLA